MCEADYLMRHVDGRRQVARYDNPVAERLADAKAVEIHHHDIEKHAESFNEGYAAAMAQVQPELDALDRVRALAELPDPHNPRAYQHYAVPIGKEVEMGVLVDDLRAVIDIPEEASDG